VYLALDSHGRILAAYAYCVLLLNSNLEVERNLLDAIQDEISGLDSYTSRISFNEQTGQLAVAFCQQLQIFAVYAPSPVKSRRRAAKLHSRLSA